MKLLNFIFLLFMISCYYEDISIEDISIEDISIIEASKLKEMKNKVRAELSQLQKQLQENLERGKTQEEIEKIRAERGANIQLYGGTEAYGTHYMSGYIRVNNKYYKILNELLDDDNLTPLKLSEQFNEAVAEQFESSSWWSSHTKYQMYNLTARSIFYVLYYHKKERGGTYEDFEKREGADKFSYVAFNVNIFKIMKKIIKRLPYIPISEYDKIFTYYPYN